MTHRERDLLQRLYDAGVRLTVLDGDRLRYTAPAGALTPELRAAMEELKPALIFAYHDGETLWADARLPRDEAARKAREDLEDAEFIRQVAAVEAQNPNAYTFVPTTFEL